jgi:TPR repeat protein
MVFCATLGIRIRKIVLCFLVGVVGSADAVDSDEAALVAWQSGDRASALTYWRERSADGNAEANLFLGYLHRSGSGVVQDDRVASEYYLAAAAAGSPEAQYEIGLMYEMGIGVERDNGEASRWYGLSSAQRCPDELSAGGRLGDR